MQDPVAEPWAAGIQTLQKEQGRKHTPYSESFQDPAEKAAGSPTVQCEKGDICLPPGSLARRRRTTSEQ